MKAGVGPENLSGAGVQTGRTEGAEVEVGAARFQDRSGRSITVELVNPLRLLHGKQADIPQNFARVAVYAKGMQINFLQKDQRLVRGVGAQTPFHVLGFGCSLMGRREPNLVPINHRGGPTATWNRGLPNDAFGLAPSGRRMGFHSGMPLPAWPTPFGPLRSGCPRGDGSEQGYEAFDLKKRVHQWMAGHGFSNTPPRPLPER